MRPTSLLLASLTTSAHADEPQPAAETGPPAAPAQTGAEAEAERVLPTGEDLGDEPDREWPYEVVPLLHAQPRMSRSR